MDYVLDHIYNIVANKLRDFPPFFKEDLSNDSEFVGFIKNFYRNVVVHNDVLKNYLQIYDKTSLNDRMALDHFIYKAYKYNSNVLKSKDMYSHKYVNKLKKDMCLLKEFYLSLAEKMKGHGEVYIAYNLSSGLIYRGISKDLYEQIDSFKDGLVYVPSSYTFLPKYFGNLSNQPLISKYFVKPLKQRFLNSKNNSKDVVIVVVDISSDYLPRSFEYLISYFGEGSGAVCVFPETIKLYDFSDKLSELGSSLDKTFEKSNVIAVSFKHALVNDEETAKNLGLLVTNKIEYYHNNNSCDRKITFVLVDPLTHYDAEEFYEFVDDRLYDVSLVSVKKRKLLIPYEDLLNR